jgi:RND superfamily putative drug exporter
MGGTGRVVTAAGLVFAFTMASMVVSDLRVVGQVGTTIGLGLLFDTLVVRAFMMPSVAAMLGRWFWWPLNVRSHPPRIKPHPVTPDVVPRPSESGHRLESAHSPSDREGQNGGSIGTALP